jgi:hypothetical protein
MDQGEPVGDEETKTEHIFVEIPSFSDQEFKDIHEMKKFLDGVRLLKTNEDFPPEMALYTLFAGRGGDSLKNGDLIAGIISFINSINLGIYPPLAVLEWLRDGFEKYMENDGKNSVDKCLGLESSRGKAPLVARMKIENRNAHYSMIMHILVNEFSVNIRDAACMVHAREIEAGRNCPSDSWIEQQFREKWKPSELCRIDDFYQNNETERKAKFISSFPSYSIPTILKKTYGIG